MPIRLIHTEGFRISAIFVAIFALSAAVLAITVLFIINDEFHDQIVQFANADIAAVRDGYRTQGVREAREVIEQRMAAPGASDFFLLQQGTAAKLAGNLDPMPPRTGVIMLPYPNKDSGHMILGVGDFVAPGLYVFSGSDLYHAYLARKRILYALVWIFIGALALASLGGFVVSRSFLRRTDTIVRTCRAIMDGNLKTRIPLRGSRDELDRLSETINLMLDRISTLMENLRQITNDVAHDLRTPVTHLRHRLERARSQSTTTADYDRALQDAITASDDILALFTALLRITQIEGGARRAAFKSLNLVELLRHLQDVFGPVAEGAGHRLIAAIPGPATVVGDHELLTQLFSNLIENSIIHTPPDTTIMLDLSVTKNDVRVMVSDDGPGVPPEEHQSLFQRLYRREASRTKPGYGLGLSLVAAIADLHGAKVSTQGKNPHGFSVEVSFPLLS